MEEEEEQKKFFPNKKDQIIQHFKKCPHFVTKTTAEKRAEIFKLLENDSSLRPDQFEYLFNITCKVREIREKAKLIG